MGKRVILLLILCAAGLVGYFYYRHHQDEVRMASGEVTCDGCMTPEQHARFLRENAGETADSQSERRAKGPVADDTKTSNTTSTSTTALPAAATTTAPQVPPAAAAVPASTSAPSTSAAALPADAPKSDSITPNPTNGMVFAGKGTYQWYRQGNLTWRVDTTSGRSCIIYATMEEWRKQIVLSHGCGRTA